MNVQIDDIMLENGRITVERDNFVSEYQRLAREVATRKDSIQELEEEHWVSIVKWSSIVGAVTCIVTVLVMCSGFRYYYSNQKKQWEIQRLQELLRVNNEHQKVMDRSHRRPRSHSLDELHHKLGMNEIDTLTAKEAGNLVRIARPLETVGAERKLSEELPGIEPIICNGNEGRKETDGTAPNTETKGEGKEGNYSLQSRINLYLL